MEKRINTSSLEKWGKKDTAWMLGLYGTAIGAGTLFFPINAGIGGLWPLLIMTILAFPLTYFSHLGLSRFILSGSTKDGDITKVVTEHFGAKIGNVITLLYFCAIYPILLVYSVAITNTVLSMIRHQFNIALSDDIGTRAIFSFILLALLMSIARLGGATIVRTMGLLVYPFIYALILIAIYLIPNWTMAIIDNNENIAQAITHKEFYKTLWLAIPVMVFSFNHSPIISSFSVAQKTLHPNNPQEGAKRILCRAHIMMVFSVMFFTFSCIFSLTTADLISAKQQNIGILSYLANHFSNPFIAWVAPIIAILAISKSFLGHYLGTKEGLIGLMTQGLHLAKKSDKQHYLEKVTIIFIFLTCWTVAIVNPSILGMIETLGGPIIAILLFLMPMYAIHKVPALHQYKGAISNIFVTVSGLIALSAIFYTLFI